jgi:hypothetical protein
MNIKEGIFVKTHLCLKKERKKKRKKKRERDQEVKP